MSETKKEFVPLLQRKNGSKLGFILAGFLLLGFVYLIILSARPPLVENRRLFKQGDYFGYKNEEGAIVIPPRYSTANNFNNGYAIVGLDGKFGTIGYDGELLTPLKIEKLGEVISDTTVRLAHVGKDTSLLMPDGTLFSEPGQLFLHNDRYRSHVSFEPLGATLGTRSIVIGEKGKILFDNNQSKHLSFDYEDNFSASYVEDGVSYAAVFSKDGSLIYKSEKFDVVKLTKYGGSGNDIFIVEKEDKKNLYNSTTGDTLLPWVKGSITAPYRGLEKEAAIHVDGDTFDILYSPKGKEIARFYEINNYEWDGARKFKCHKESKFGLISDKGKKLIPCVAGDVTWDHDQKSVRLYKKTYVFEDDTGEKFSSVDSFISEIKKNNCLKEPKKRQHKSRQQKLLYKSASSEKECVTGEGSDADISDGSMWVEFVNDNPYPVKIEARIYTNIFEGRYSAEKLYCEGYSASKVIFIKPNDSDFKKFRGVCNSGMTWSMRRYFSGLADLQSVDKLSMEEYVSATSQPSRSSRSQASRSGSQCSGYTTIYFEAGGFLSDNADSLSVRAPSGAYVANNDNSSVGVNTGECIGGRYNYTYSVKTGVYQDKIKTFSGAFTLSGSEAQCTVFVDGGSLSCD